MRYPLSCLLIVAAALGSLATAPAQGAPAELRIVLTADTEGHVGPCGGCPAHAGFGGVGRGGATILGRLRPRAAAQEHLVVDAGNAIAGDDSADSRGRVIVAAYNAMGYDALNLSHRDFRWGKAHTLEVLKGATFAALSANLVDAETGRPLVRPYVVKAVGERRIAFLGISEPPAGLDFLPQLKRSLIGMRVRPPAEALEEWLPKAKAEGDDVVLVYHGSPEGLAAVGARFGRELLAVLVGGIRPEQLPVADAGPPVIATSEHGKHVARVRLTAGPGPRVEVTQVAVEPTLEPDQRMETLLAAFRASPAGPATAPPPVGAVAATPAPVVPPATPPATAPAARVALSPPATVPASSPPVASAPPAARPVARKKPDKDAKPPDRVTAKQDLEPKGIAGVGLTPEQVNSAIDRGAEFLWNHIGADPRKKQKLGDDVEHSLACLALVHAGAHKRFPAFDQELRAYLAREDPRGDNVYHVGIFCMLVEAYGDPEFLPKLRRGAQYLIEGQGPEGAWSYTLSTPDEAFAEASTGRALRVTGGRPLDGSEAAGDQMARVNPWDKGYDGDNSVTQYATLGIQAAERAGLRMPRQTWQRNLAVYRKRHCKDGGWNYITTSTWSYGSMTCAGVCGIAIARHALGEREPGADEQIERGLAWLAANWTVTENPKDAHEWHYYYLYGLERVGQILGTEFIGEHEWYPLGARYLVDAQKADGRWESKPDSTKPILPTAFALLFLKRATPSLAMVVKRGGRGTLKTAVVSPPARVHVILDCSGSMLAEIGGRQKFHLARDAVAALINELPDDAEVGLRVYGHRKAAIEQGASDDTELLIPPRKLERQAFLATLGRLRARGKTPLAKSLAETKDDLAGSSAKEPVTLVLLTDGGEDTFPRRDPLKPAAELTSLKGVRLHVVGFDIGREDWSEQLRAIARAAHGRYYPAAEGAALLRELRASVFGQPDGFVALDADGREAARGEFGASVSLLEGKYRLRASYGGAAFEEAFWINTDAVTAVAFDASHATASEPATPPAASPPGAAVALPTPPPAGGTTSQPAPSPAKPKFCTQCGQKLPVGGKFCTACGARVAQEK